MNAMFCLQLTESVRGSVGMSLKSSLASNLRIVHPILKNTLRLSEVMIISGLLKISIVEGRMKMEPGGMQRQALRLGTHRHTRHKHIHTYMYRYRHKLLLTFCSVIFSTG